MSFLKLHVLIGSIAVLTVAHAAPINGGFESGDLSSWTVDIPTGTSSFPPGDVPAGTAEVVSTWSGGNMPAVRGPEEGNHFLALGTLEFGFFTGGGTYDISASQTLTLHQGETLTGAVFYYNGDYAPQDSAWVKIFDAGSHLLATPWLEFSGGLSPSDPNSVPYQSASPWTGWQWTAPETGDYTLRFGVSTFGDNRFATYGFFDGIGVASAVPEPSSAALLVALLAGFGVVRRKRTRLNAGSTDGFNPG